MGIIITITSKNRITIPLEIIKSLGLKKGDKLKITAKNKTIILEKIKN